MKKFGKVLLISLGVFLTLVLSGMFIMKSAKNQLSRVKAWDRNPQGSFRVIIYTGNSGWKNELCEKISTNLGSDTFVMLRGVNELNKSNTIQADRIIIIDSLMMGTLNKKVDDFLRAAQNKSKILLVNTVTAGIVPDYGVDTITTASYQMSEKIPQGDTTELALMIAKKILP